MLQGTEPVALKRTVGYDGANMEMSPQTPHGYKQTEITLVSPCTILFVFFGNPAD